jgi:hypothetical protein
MRMGDFSWNSKAVASIKGTPSCLLFPVGAHPIQQMLQQEDLPLALICNNFMTVLGTVMCMLVNKLAKLQICKDL